VCTWYLNWGRILLQDVTVVGISEAHAAYKGVPHSSALMVPETGRCAWLVCSTAELYELICSVHSASKQRVKVLLTTVESDMQGRPCAI
jgi:hypothetical protein